MINQFFNKNKFILLFNVGVITIFFYATEIITGIYMDNLWMQNNMKFLSHPCTKEIANKKAEHYNILQEISGKTHFYHVKGISVPQDYSGEYVNYKNMLRKTCNKNIKNSVQIAVFGGSTIEGVNVSDCETIPSLLNKETNSKIVNYGHRSHATVHHVNAIQDIYQYDKEFNESDILIFIDGINDLVYDMGFKFSKFDTPKLSLLESTNMFKFIKLMIDKNVKINLSLFFNKPKIEVDGECKSGKAIPTSFIGKDEPETMAKEIAKRMIEHYKMIQTYCDTNQKTCLFFIQPTPFNNGSVPYKFYDTSGTFNELQVNYFNIFSKEAIKLGRENKLKIIDLGSLLDNVEDAYVDKIHYSKKASAIISNAVAESLKVK